MKTQEEKLKHVMEAVDECWHRASYFSFASKGEIRCEKCKRMVKYQNTNRTKDPAFAANPSPDDLNELFRLAGIIQPDLHLNLYFGADKLDGFITVADGTDFAQSMLDAIFIATGGEET